MFYGGKKDISNYVWMRAGAFPSTVIIVIATSISAK